MPWIHPGEPRPDDLFEVRHAIDRAQLLYGSNGQVTVDSGLLRMLLEATEGQDDAVNKLDDANQTAADLRETVSVLYGLLKGLLDAGQVPAAFRAQVTEKLEETLESAEHNNWELGDIEAMEKQATRHRDFLLTQVTE